jgi:DGQHR domain-containing protein
MPSTGHSDRIKRPSYPAFPLTQNDHRFYFSTIPVGDLYPYCFVSRRENDPEAGFQRSLNTKRAEDIARYLAKGTGSIPTNIVLSAQGNAQINYNSRAKTLSFDRVEKAFLVLDGQHRLLGYHLCKENHKKDLRVPVSIYVNLSRATETSLFIDINTTQRGVPAALLLDIKQVANIETHMEQSLRQLFDRFNKDSKSPLSGKLSPSQSASGKISRVTFNRSLQSVLRSPLMLDVEDEARYTLIRNYLSALDAELDNKKLLTKSAFFEAVFSVFDEAIRIVTTTSGNAKQGSIQSIIRPIAKLDYSTLSDGSAKRIGETMKAAIQKSVSITSDMV